jgi:DNA-binding NtrC family response regulator
VRELRNLVQRAVLFANGFIRLSDLPHEVRMGNAADLVLKACSHCLVKEGMSFDQVMDCLEAHLLREALEKSGGNKTHAARSLGLNLSSFCDKLKRHGLDQHGSDDPAD